MATTIKVNGQSQELAKPIPLSELLILNRIEQPDMVSIQLNGEFVYKEDYETLINDGDEVDFLYFMGGGNSITN
ncbi:MAG: sulfur carrier protein ThiS [Dysgonamonadaceae bacterium]|jgi:sulfur carrier protein|nr:sulfur carrier protein ThiS [Dysgonamonadaceae bacterium]